MIRCLGVALAVGVLAAPLEAGAQTTAIAPDVGVPRGLGTTVAQTGRVVTIDGGTLAGANLFHSFSQFSLATGDTAAWVRSAGGAAGISNLINRVTGGQVSQIAGVLDASAFPNASFFFINPAGVVFGAGAQVNVPGAAYFSTAGQLRFADGARFAVATPDGSTLSVAAPESFGFVGGQGAISIGGVGDTFAPGVSLSLSAADVAFDQATLTVRGLDVAAVGAGAASARLADAPAAGGGSVTIRGGRIVAVPSAGVAGSIRIGGGQVILDGGLITAFTGGPARGGDIRFAADSLRAVNGANVFSSASAGGAGGDILAQARSVVFESATFGTVNSGAGAGGRIAVSADTIDLSAATLASNATGAGRGGDVTVTATRTITGNAANFLAQTYGGGAGGDVTVTAPSIQLDFSNATAGAGGGGRPGKVTLRGDRIRFSGGVYGSAPGAGSDSGDLTIAATTSFQAGNFANFSVASYTNGVAGSITISAPQLSLDSAFINSSVFGEGGLGSGAGGKVSLSGGDIRLVDALIDSDSLSAGAAGAVTVKGDTVLVRNTTISSSAGSVGDAGSVTLEGSRTVTLDTGARVLSETRDDGRGGAVTLKGGALTLDDATVSSAATGGFGNAGSVLVQSDSLSLADATISSDALSLGHGGDVVIRTGNLMLDGQGREFTHISSEAQSRGDAGSVNIEAKSMVLRRGGYVSSSAIGDGQGGGVSIKTGSLTVFDGSYVASDTFGDGGAGAVSVTADELTVEGVEGDGLTYISSDTLGGGDAGPVTIQAGKLTLKRNGFISSSTYTGANAGDVSVQGKTIRLESGGTIASAAVSGSFGAAGELGISADSLDLASGAQISTASNNEQQAGVIRIATKRLNIDGSQTGIGSENLAGAVAFGNVAGESGAAGAIHVTADRITIANGGRISTNSFAGAAGDIEIVMPIDSTLTLKGLSTPGSIQTSSGIGTGGRISISAPLAIVSNGGSILALGQQRGANVDIRSRYFINSADRVNTVAVDGEFKLVAGVYDVSAGTVNRDLSVLDASKVLRGQCPVARSTGQVSQLVTRPVGPYAPRPAFDAVRPGAGAAAANAAGGCR